MTQLLNKDKNEAHGSRFIVKNRFLLWLLFLSLCGSICAGVSQITITLYAINLGASSSQIGFIKGFSGLGVFLTVLPMGFLVDHFGPKKMFIAGGLIDSLVYLFMPLANTPQYLMLGMAVLGFFSSFRSVALSAVFLDKLELFGSNKAGWNKAVYSTGLSFIGPLLGGYLVKYINYSWTFYFVSALHIAAVSTAVLVLEKAQVHKAKEILSFSGAVEQLKTIFKNKRFIGISAIDTLTTTVFSCFTVFVIVIGLRNFALPKEKAALLVSVEGLSYIGALFMLGRLLKAIGCRNTYLCGIFSIIPGLCLLAGTKTIFWLWPACAFLGFGIGILGLVNISQISVISGKKGRLAAANNLFIFIGVMLGPVIGGFVGNIIGLQAIFWVFVPLFIILAFIIYFKFEPLEKCVSVTTVVDAALRGDAIKPEF